MTGYQLFHNCIRPHEGLKDKTPAEECGIEVKGEKKLDNIHFYLHSYEKNGTALTTLIANLPRSPILPHIEK